MRRKNGKAHTYWALVESYRTGRGSRQRVVAYLGELKRSERSGWAHLGRNLSGKSRPQPSLFDPPEYDEPADDEAPVLVRLKAMLRRFEEHLLEKNWQEVQEGVEVKLMPGPDGSEVFVLARSADRRKKEEAMHRRFLDRFEAALLRMQAQAESGRLKDPALANRRLGRLAQQYWRAAGALEVTIQRRRGPGKARLKVSWKHNARWSDWAALSEGCYLLRTNLKETDPAILWKRYIQLTEAEWAFRISKDELEIRPIWHQSESRVLAHILVCFLAYVLWKTLAGWMQRAGLGDAPRTLLEELAKIKSGDVVLPTVTRHGEPSKTIRLRCVTEPDAGQRVLLHRLGIQLPRRLRRLDEVGQM